MKKYVFKPYNKLFSLLFDQEKARILSYLQGSLLIEHVGSTAVEGLGGKGIIDIAIAVSKEAIDAASIQLQSLGYEFRPSFSTSERLYFVIFLPDPEEGTRRYHIHLTYPESREWKELLAFRDYLRNNPEKAQEYAQVKKQAAVEANQDGKKYKQFKEHIFQNAKATLLLRPKRIAIFGIPGSGKSTFAVNLSEQLKVPLFHMDKFFFCAGWKERDYNEFLNIQHELVEKEQWIIEGNATKSLEMRFRRADVILYFRFNRLLCLWRILKRLIWKNPPIYDRAEGCHPTIRLRLIRYLWGFDNRVKKSIDDLEKKYPSVLFYEFSNDQQAKDWMQSLCLEKDRE